MYRKLIKYDLKSLWRFAMPTLLAVAGVTLFGVILTFTYNVFLADFAEQNDGVLAFAVSVGYAILRQLVTTVLGMAGGVISIAVMVDFYNSLITDQGYLTFTLPVRAKDIILSKFTNALLWIFAVGAAVLGGNLLIGLTEAATQPILPDDFWGDIGQIPTPFDRQVPLLLFLILLLIVCIAVCDVLLYFVAIFLGSVIAKKNKMLASIGCVVGANFVFGLVSAIVVVCASLTGALLASEETALLVINSILAILCVFLVGAAFGLYFLLKHMMERKLNLP